MVPRFVAKKQHVSLAQHVQRCSVIWLNFFAREPHRFDLAKTNCFKEVCMKNYLITLIGAALLVSTIGCANGPLRQWLQGAPCNACNPQIQQPLNVAPPCNNCAENAVGSGILGRLFSGNQSQQPQFAGCENGACSAAPLSMPASNFAASELPFDTSSIPTSVSSVSNALPPLVVDSDLNAAPPASELYGNTNTVGRLELPPLSYNKN